MDHRWRNTSPTDTQGRKLGRWHRPSLCVPSPCELLYLQKRKSLFGLALASNQPHIEIATSNVRLVASSAPVAASSKQTSTDFCEISSEIITVTVFGSILLLSLSAIFSFTSPVASSNPYEALTGTDTHFLLALSSIRTFGGSNPNRLDSP